MNPTTRTTSLVAADVSPRQTPRPGSTGLLTGQPDILPLHEPAPLSPRGGEGARRAGEGLPLPIRWGEGWGEGNSPIHPTDSSAGRPLRFRKAARGILHRIQARIIPSLALAISLLFAPGANAETRLLPFQGRLTDANGNAIADGVKVVQFKIYDAPVGGRAVWNGEVHKLSVNEGLVNTLLGTKADLNAVDFDQNLYLELTIDANDDGEITPADPPLLPRQSIIPAFFAKESADSRLLGGYSWSALFGTNNPADGTLLSSKFGDSSIHGTKIQPRTIHDGLIQNNTLTASTLAQEVVDMLVPPGSIMAFGGSTNAIPSGWLLCDGRAVRSSEFTRLFQTIGTAWGSGIDDDDATTDFNLPDLRGRFLRGVDGGAGLDPNANVRLANTAGGNTGNQVGSFQGDAFKTHRHRVALSGNTMFAGLHSHQIKRSDGRVIRWGDGAGNSEDRIDAADAVGADPHTLEAASAGSHSHGVHLSGFSDDTGGAETRPKNAYVVYIIKH
jgi:microcystin-dependent protein